MNKKTHEEINQRILRAINTVIDQQIAENNPPEVNETFERLLEEGFTEEETYTLIGHLVSMEVAEEIAGAEGFNIERYVDALEKLPAPFAKSKKSDSDEE